MEQFENKPPSWALALLRAIIHPEFQEEIEGDLLEKYQSDLLKYGNTSARKQFYLGIFSVLKPNLIFNLKPNMMNTRILLTFLVVAILTVIASIAPFLIGSGNDFFYVVSQFAQTIGHIGLVFIPFGLVWLIIEIRNKKEQRLNLWSNGYYFSWLSITPILLFFPLQTAMSIHEGRFADLFPLSIFVCMLVFVIYRIQKLKKKTAYKFNPAPLYITLIPVVALFTSKFAVEQAASFRREKAIEKTKPLIAAIEKYKTLRGEYPEKLEDLEGKYISEIPKLNLIGVKAYYYEKQNGFFQLAFEQFWHWNATEVVVYHPSGQYHLKGNYENYPTEYANWWYYMAD